jgi:hypothetical protein
MQAAFLFTVVGTTGFLAVLAGQLPGVLLFPWHLLYVLSDKMSIEDLNHGVPSKLIVISTSKWKGIKDLMNLLQLSLPGLGLLCSLLDWKHFIDRIGCRKRCSRVRVSSPVQVWKSDSIA